MFNLLPDNLKDKIKSEYKLRKIILIFIFVLLVQMSFFIFLFPSWLTSFYGEKEAEMQSQNVSQSVVASSTNSIVSAIKSINSQLAIIDKQLEYPKVVPAFSVIISKKTSSIHIDQFDYTSSSAKAALISIQGVSNTREALVAFQKSLQDSGYFKSVDLPVSNLAQDQDINFSMSLTISP